MREQQQKAAEASPEAKQGLLTTRPREAPAEVAEPGVHPLGLGHRRDGLLMVPPGGRAARPLLVLLHGAGGNAAGMLRMFEQPAREARIALLVPESRGPTWDVIMGGFGPDVAFIDAALRQAFATLPLDPHRLAIGGFSDGASYALSLGLANGTLFQSVLAFSPGFVAAPSFQGQPRIFISHGVDDEVLPIDRCSRRLAPRLRKSGYALRYDEFEGGHYVPEDAARNALALMRSD
jgi:phospholipase/carboxylesterase